MHQIHIMSYSFKGSKTKPFKYYFVSNWTTLLVIFRVSNFFNLVLRLKYLNRSMTNWPPLPILYELIIRVCVENMASICSKQQFFWRPIQVFKIRINSTKIKSHKKLFEILFPQQALEHKWNKQLRLSIQF